MTSQIRNSGNYNEPLPHSETSKEKSETNNPMLIRLLTKLLAFRIHDLITVIRTHCTSFQISHTHVDMLHEHIAKNTQKYYFYISN